MIGLVVNDVVDAQRADCVRAVGQDCWHAVFFVEGLLAAIAGYDYALGLSSFGVGQGLGEVGFWLTYRIHFIFKVIYR